jgi:hypothetical protein
LLSAHRPVRSVFDPPPPPLLDTINFHMVSRNSISLHRSKAEVATGGRQETGNKLVTAEDRRQGERKQRNGCGG